MAEVVLVVCLFINAGLFIPQMFTIWRQGSSVGISKFTFSGLFFIQLMMLMYAVAGRNYLLIVGFSLSTISCGVMLFFAIYYGRKNLLSINSLSPELILEQLPGHVYWKDLSCTFIGSNKNNFEDFGFSSLENYQGKTDYDAFSKEEADRLRLVDEQVIREKKCLIVEEALTKKDGSKALYLSHKIPLRNKKGKVIGVLGYSVDIIDTKQATEDRLVMLENIISIMPGNVYWTDETGMYLGCNDNEAKAVGLSSRKDIIGKRNTDLAAFVIPEILEPINMQVLTEGRAISIEEPAILPNGKKATLLSNKVPLRNQKNKVIGMVGISIDITAEKEAQALRLTNKKNEEKLKAEKQFHTIAEQVVHDIRSPLASLLMIIKSCHTLPEANRIALREATTSINDIAENLLQQWNRDSSIATTYNNKAQPLILALSIARTLTEKRHQYKDNQIKLTEQTNNANIFTAIHAIPSDFKRLLSNLINNAADAYENKPGEVCISLSTNDKQAIITIQDWGKGIPPDVLKKIRQKFSVTAGKEGGHGIGLAQVNKTLLAMEGEVTFNSVVGEGTIVTLTLPRCPAPKWLATDITIQQGDTVIVLDDDESIHFSWDQRFKDIAIDPIHFTNGQEAIDYINRKKNNTPLFLLTDFELLNQPVNGLDVINQTGVSNAMLVTSHINTEAVIAGVIAANVTLLPKQFAADVVIQINQSATATKKVSSIAIKKPDAIFIDDSTTFTGSLHFCFSNNDIATYNDPFVLLDEITQYSKDTPIFTDNGLASTLTGIDLAEKLHAMGYEKLYLLSGRDFKADELPSYLAAIGKTNIDQIETILGG